MDKVAESIVNWQIQKNVIKAEDRAVYVYAYEILLMRISSLLIAVIVGALTDNLTGVLVFLASYIPLRTYAGGYHARDSIRCMIDSTLLIAAVAVITKLPLFREVSLGLLVFAAAGLISCLFIFVLAPVADENKPLDDIERKHYALRAKIISAIEVLAAFICFLSEQKGMGSILMLTQIVMALMLVLGSINKREKV